MKLVTCFSIQVHIILCSHWFIDRYNYVPRINEKIICFNDQEYNYTFEKTNKNHLFINQNLNQNHVLSLNIHYQSIKLYIENITINSTFLQIIF